ncbi:MAG: tetratricopeptide repeat protein, partial [Polyangiaceae bacterium]
MNPDSPLRRLTWLLVVTSLLYAFPSHADDTATAQRLFDEAKALRKAGKWEQACAKFEASLALDASVGTYLNVAKCQERKGQIASALSNYEHALAKSRSLDDDAHQQAVQKYAASKMTAIKPRVPQLRIVIEPRPRDLVIERNGVTVPLGALGHRLYVDPGPHHVVARAQHFEPAEETI